MKPIICTVWSFRGVTDGSAPRVLSPRPVVMDSGLAAFDRRFIRTPRPSPFATEGRRGQCAHRQQLVRDGTSE